MPETALRALDLTVRRRIESLLAGDHRAASLGIAMELAQVRPYQPGDDVRLIDWNATARMNEPHVRLHVAERALTTWLVFDASPSMGFGTALRRKADVAEGVVLAVGHVASRRGNRLGLLTYGHPDPLFVPPRQGRVGLVGVLLQMREVADRPTTTRAPSRPTTWATRSSRTRRHARERALDRRRQRPARPARLESAACASWRRATTSSCARSATPPRRPCPTSARSSSSIPRRAATARRHRQPQAAARALRRRRRRGARAGRARHPRRRRPSPAAVHR